MSQPTVSFAASEHGQAGLGEQFRTAVAMANR
jgi:hypothetical protein